MDKLTHIQNTGPENKNKQVDGLYQSIKDIIQTARTTVYRAANFTMVQAYWNIGQQIIEVEQQGETRAKYGESLLAVLSERLTKDFGKGFDERELRRIRQFYLSFSIRDSLRPELSWTHYRKLVSVENEQARMWYMNEAANENWSSRQLNRQISVLYFERLLSSTIPEAVKNEAVELLGKPTPEEFIRNPYILNFMGLKTEASYFEKDIEQGLIDNIQSFLLELGKGFSFVARQKHMQFDDSDFYIDLVFYNYILKCFVLIDLKLGELTHQDVGQMDSYVRMYEETFRAVDDNPTIGLILCSKRNEAIVKYSILNDNKNIFASKYLLYLPTEEELKREIEKERNMMESLKEKDKE